MLKRKGLNYNNIPASPFYSSEERTKLFSMAGEYSNPISVYTL